MTPAVSAQFAGGAIEKKSNLAFGSGRDLLIFDGSPSARLEPVIWIEVSFPRYLFYGCVRTITQLEVS